MNISLINSNIQYENNIEDFQLSYRLQSRTDIEVMTLKYNRLRKSSYGYIVRLGIPDRRDIKW